VAILEALIRYSFPVIIDLSRNFLQLDEKTVKIKNLSKRGCSMNKSPIRVMLVNNEKMILLGLVEYLSCFDDLIVVSEAQDSSHAMEEIHGSRPDVVLLDQNLPDLNGIETTRAILNRYPSLRVILLSTYHDEELNQAAIQAGAASCILKDVSNNRLIKAIRGNY
jgi:DNA-binding NarL/FixJ family response regulator